MSEDRFDKYGEDLFQKTQFANAVNSLIENKAQHIRYIKTMAELRYTKYQALLDMGFEKDQALLIVTNTKVMD
jgi:hypothetical protein